MKLCLEKATLKALAKEFRRAAWGSASFVAGFSVYKGTGVGMVVAAATWVVLQVLALVVESVEV